MTSSALAAYYDLKHNSCIWINNLYMCFPLVLYLSVTAVFIQLWHLICKIFSKNTHKHIISRLLILYVSVHVKLSDMLIDRRFQALRKGHKWTHCVGGFRLWLVLAFENWFGSQALWLCQEGVRADLCYTLPSIREQITLLGGEAEGHRAIPREAHCCSYWEWRSRRTYMLPVWSEWCSCCGLQTGEISGWVGLMFHFSLVAFSLLSSKYIC